MEYQDVVRDVLSRPDLKDFVVENLRESMTNLGFSQGLINEFCDNIANLDLYDTPEMLNAANNPFTSGGATRLPRI
jgi:hypothetical protein